MNLSDHISLDEMTRTEVRLFIEQNKLEAIEFIPSLRRVALELVEPIRFLFHNDPIIIHSGFRCPALNQAVGGSPTSQHMVGQAVDFDIDTWATPNGRMEALRLIADSQIKFRQLLIEGGCLHISLPNDGLNGEVAYWNAGTKKIIRAGA